MGVLKDLETFLLPPSRLIDDGVPSVSIALLEPSGRISAHVINASTGGSDTHTHTHSSRTHPSFSAPPPRPPPHDPETLYQACSISKSLTALCVARLVDAGLLTWETKVVSALPADVVAALTGDPRTAQLLEVVSVEMLLAHRSGLSQGGFAGYGEGDGGGGAGGGGDGRGGILPSYAQIFAGEAPANHPRIRFVSFPGSQMKYSGGGYVLLQAFLEELTGESFGELMRKWVLAPLGMRRSRFGDPEEDEEGNYARAYWTATHPAVGSGRKGYWRFAELAAAGLWTTPSDLLRAVRAVQTSLHPELLGPEANGRGFMSAETARRMLTVPEPRDSDSQMAMGWRTDGRFFAHAGENMPGYVSYVIGCQGSESGPDAAPVSWGGHSQAGTGISVMINSMVGHETWKRIVSAIFVFKTWMHDRALPGLGSLDEVIPFAGPEGVYMPNDFCNEIVGKWEDGWEIQHDDRGGLEVMFGDLLVPMRLRPAAVSPHLMDGTKQLWVVVDGLDIAFTLTVDPETNETLLMVVQKSAKKLRRVSFGE